MGDSMRDPTIADRSFAEKFARGAEKRGTFLSSESETRTFDDKKEDDEPEEPKKDDSSLRTMKVYLRLKPFSSRIKLKKEQRNAYTITSPTTLLTKLSCLEGSAGCLKKPRINREATRRRFTFTRTFGPETSQMQLFDQTVKQLMTDFLIGQSATVMTYGTTNAGKTYTLLGTSSSPGIIPHSIGFIFSNVNCSSLPWYKPTRRIDVISLDKTVRILETEARNKLLSSRSIDCNQDAEVYRLLENSLRKGRDNCDNAMYSVWLSFVEIYNETVYDLLAEDDRGNNLPLKLVRDMRGVTFAKGMKMVCAGTAIEAYRILMAGQSRLSVASTAQNCKSSRSHCVFTIKLLRYFREHAVDEVESSTLSFCDLAGSGRLRKTLNVGKRLKEAQNINASLLVLGRCLKAVLEGQTARQNVEVVGSFRESKLTRLFQRALSGKETLCLIINVDPSPDQYVPTQSVLDFSAIAKKIMVEPTKVVGRSKATVDNNWNDTTPSLSLVSISEQANLDVREDCDEVRQRNEKLEKEIAVLKGSTLDREYEIRREMASFCAGKLKSLEADWRNRTREMEEQREDLLKWSVKQVENFYKERIDSMNNRKRRRTGGDGDYCNDDGEMIDELEVENARLTSTIVSLKEMVKDFKEDGERLETEKNTRAFELALAKEELKNLWKLVRTELGDDFNDPGDKSLVHELRRLLSDKNEVIEKLEDSLDKVKKEYRQASASVEDVKRELTDARKTLAENSARTKDLVEELGYSNVHLSQKSDYIEVLQGRLEVQRKRLIEADAMAQEVHENCSKSEARAANLSWRLEKLETILRENEIDLQRSSTKLEENRKTETLEFRDSTREYRVVETEDSLLEEDSSETESKLSSRISKLLEFEDANEGESQDTNVETPDRTSFLVSIDKLERIYRSSSGDNSIDDSGIIVSAESSAEICNASSTSSSGVKVETKDKGSQTSRAGDKGSSEIQEKINQLKLDYTGLKARHSRETSRMTELSRELENVKSMIQILKESSSCNAPRVEEYREKLAIGERNLERASVARREVENKLKEMSRILETRNREYESRMESMRSRLKVSEENESRTSKRLEEYLEKSSSLENQLSAVYEQLERTSVKCFMEHVPRIDKLEKELSSKTRPVDEMDGSVSKVERDFVRLTELSNEVRRFESILEECQRVKEDLVGQLRERSERQSRLECSLTTLTERIRERENEILSLRAELEEVVRTNATNGEFVKELSKEIADVLKRLAGAKEDARWSEEARRKLERTSRQEIESLQVRLTAFEKSAALASAIRTSEVYSRGELERLKIELHEKRREMKFLRRNRDRIILKYELLIRQLRGDAGRMNGTLIKTRGLFPRRVIFEDAVGNVKFERKAKKVSMRSEESFGNESYQKSIGGRFNFRSFTIPRQAGLQIRVSSVEESRSARGKKLLIQTDEACIDLEASQVPICPTNSSGILLLFFSTLNQTFQTILEPEVKLLSTERITQISSSITSDVCIVDDSDCEITRAARWSEIGIGNRRTKLIVSEDESNEGSSLHDDEPLS